VWGRVWEEGYGRKGMGGRWGEGVEVGRGKGAHRLHDTNAAIDAERARRGRCSNKRRIE
jgi:hypothetical protein